MTKRFRPFRARKFNITSNPQARLLRRLLLAIIFRAFGAKDDGLSNFSDKDFWFSYQRVLSPVADPLSPVRPLEC